MAVKVAPTVLIALACGVVFACADAELDAGGDIIPTGNPNGVTDGSGCVKAFDCKSGVCTAAKCAAPTSSDKVLNGTETGLDCGGPDAPLCPGGQSCKVNQDCASSTCANTKCSGAPDAPPPKGDDGIKNGDETDLDCGGKKTGAPRCALNKACAIGDDCDSKVCFGDRCAAPSATDHVENGDESDVDCGGRTTSAPRCALGKKCVEHGDCTSDACTDKGVCTESRSCTKTDGNFTCGQGEVGEAGAKHESCCLALPVPGSTVKLDKYKVTAGRMRRFVERVKNDVRGWYTTNKATLSPAAVAQIDPYVAYLPEDEDGITNDLGGFIYLDKRPSISQGCFVGSAANPGYGSHTFLTKDNPTNPEEHEDRGFDQAFLDRLPLNCVPYPMLAAFCAWDGGRLQTFAENSAAYGAGPYPWGATPEVGGYNDDTGAPQGPATYLPPAGQGYPACPQCNFETTNWSFSYSNPENGNPAKEWDYAHFISPPGRFPADKGAGGHLDLAGTFMELTATPGLVPFDSLDGVNQPTVRWSRAGSFEGHAINYGNFGFAIMTKYGKTGGRCAHD